MNTSAGRLVHPHRSVAVAGWIAMVSAIFLTLGAGSASPERYTPVPDWG
jgi:hypothetical protein